MWYVLKSKNTLRYIVEMHLAYGYSNTHIHMHGYIHTCVCGNNILCMFQAKKWVHKYSI